MNGYVSKEKAGQESCWLYKLQKLFHAETETGCLQLTELENMFFGENECQWQGLPLHSEITQTNPDGLYTESGQ